MGLTDERLDDPNLVDLTTQIHGIKMEIEAFRSKVGLYRADIDEYMAETVNFREGMMLQVEGLTKESEGLRTELAVLRLVNHVGNIRRSEFLSLKPLVVLGAPRNWRISYGIWSSTSPLHGSLK